MKVAFFGSTVFGLQCLKSIRNINNIEISGIVSNKEKFSISYNKEGVKNFLYSDFSSFADKFNIPFYRMEENMKEQGLKEFLASCKPEFIVVAGWYHLIHQEL